LIGVENNIPANDFHRIHTIWWNRRMFSYSIYVPIFFYIFYSYEDYPKCFIATAWKQTDVFHFAVSSNLLSFVIFLCDIQLYAFASNKSFLDNRSRAFLFAINSILSENKVSFILIIYTVISTILHKFERNLFTFTTSSVCMCIITLTRLFKLIKILDLSLRVYVEASHVLYLHAGLNAHDCYVAAGMREFVMHG